MALGPPRSRNLEENELVALLSALEQALSRSDPGRTTNDQFEKQLESSLRLLGGRLPQPLIRFTAPDQLFLGSPDLTVAHRLLDEAQQAPVRDTIAFLEDVILRRQDQGDLWPDGRLQVGIAYAALGEFGRARRVLEDVIAICEGGGLFLGEEEMAMMAA